MADAGIFPELCVSCRREPLQHAEHSLLSQGHRPTSLLSPTHPPHLIGKESYLATMREREHHEPPPLCDQGKGRRGRQRKEPHHLMGMLGNKISYLNNRVVAETQYGHDRHVSSYRSQISPDRWL